MRLAVLSAASLTLAACATGPTGGETPANVADTCKADAGQRFVGQRATAESGAAIMAATHSTKLRWLPPRTIVTTEYAFGRVGVAYDDAMTITRVSCG